MLDAGINAIGLDAPNQRRRYLTGQIGIFRKILKVSAAEGAALNIAAGAQQDTDTLAGGFQAQMPAHFLNQRLVPGVGKARRGGIAGSGHRGVDAQMVLPALLLPQTMGAVGEHDAGNAQPGNGLGIPEVGTGHQGRLLLQGHFIDQFFIFHIITVISWF